MWQKVPSILDEKGRSPCSAHHRCHVLLSRCLALAMAGLNRVTFLLTCPSYKERHQEMEQTCTFPFFLPPLMYLSELPEAKRYSLGWNSTTFTGPVCPVNSNINFPAVRSHSWKEERTETLEEIKCYRFPIHLGFPCTGNFLTLSPSKNRPKSVKE